MPRLSNKFALYPIETHYDNVSSLKKELLKYENIRRLNFEEQDIITQNKRKFERIRLSTGQFVCMPTNADFTLYRGQNAKHKTCSSQLYRNEISEDELFICNLRITEFELMIKQHPVANDYFAKNNIRVDYRGLAQHYGLETDLLDLTSDIDIALFFATNIYDKISDRYLAQQEDKIYTAVIYVYPIMFAACGNKSLGSMLENKLQVIGMQPFKRPMLQQGFAFKLNNKESLLAYSYTFNYTKEDSIFYHKKFDKGNLLWINDELAQRTKLLKESKVFSSDAFALAVKRHSKKYKRTDYYQKVLHQLGYSIGNINKMPWTYTNNAKQEALEEWNKTGQFDFESKLCSRKVFSEDRGWRPEMSIDEYAGLILLRSFYSFDNKNLRL